MQIIWKKNTNKLTSNCAIYMVRNQLMFFTPTARPACSQIRLDLSPGNSHRFKASARRSPAPTSDRKPRPRQRHRQVLLHPPLRSAGRLRMSGPGLLSVCAGQPSCRMGNARAFPPWRRTSTCLPSTTAATTTSARTRHPLSRQLRLLSLIVPPEHCIDSCPSRPPQPIHSCST